MKTKGAQLAWDDVDVDSLSEGAVGEGKASSKMGTRSGWAT
jgi:hypothetical protein